MLRQKANTHPGQAFSDPFLLPKLSKPTLLPSSLIICAYIFFWHISCRTALVYPPLPCSPRPQPHCELFEGRVLFLSFLYPQHIVQSLMCSEEPVHAEVEVGKEKWGRPATVVVLALWKGESTGAFV